MCRYRVQATKKQIENTSSSRTATLLETESTQVTARQRPARMYPIGTSELGLSSWLPGLEPQEEALPIAICHRSLGNYFTWLVFLLKSPEAPG